MAWQYSHYHPQTAYPTLYSDQYAGQTYQQAWYNYYQQQARAAAAAQQAGTSTGTAVPATTTVPQVTTVAPIQTAPATTTTFSTYNPTFVRDSAATGSGSGTGGRGPRRQSQLKGLFSKECERIVDAFHIAHLFLIYAPLLCGAVVFLLFSRVGSTRDQFPLFWCASSREPSDIF